MEPFFIPECGPWPATSRLLFLAIASYNAIGVAPFGIDTIFDKEGKVTNSCAALVESFAAIHAILPLLPVYQGTGHVHAIVQEEGSRTQYIELDGYVALVQFGVTWFGRPYPTMDLLRQHVGAACSSRLVQMNSMSQVLALRFIFGQLLVSIVFCIQIAGSSSKLDISRGKMDH